MRDLHEKPPKWRPRFKKFVIVFFYFLLWNYFLSPFFLKSTLLESQISIGIFVVTAVGLWYLMSLKRRTPRDAATKSIGDKIESGELTFNHKDDLSSSNTQSQSIPSGKTVKLKVIRLKKVEEFIEVPLEKAEEIFQVEVVQ